MFGLSEELPLSRLVLAGAVLWVISLITAAVYRLYFSPLAKFPGPKLAALTLWYEFYHDVVRRGKFTWEIKRMHEKYGPIVRINPYELHVADPEFYDVLYTGASQPRDKYGWHAKMFGNPTSVTATVPHDLHRLRRSVFNPFFSRQSILRLVPLIQSKINRLCERLEGFKGSGKAVNLADAYSALTMDIITEYCFKKSYGCLDDADFFPQWSRAMMEASETSHMNKQFSWFLPLMMMMPESMVEKSSPSMLSMIRFQKRLYSDIAQVYETYNSKEKSAEQRTMFHDLLDSDLPPEEKTPTKCMGEAMNIVAAGSITTAHYLKTLTFHLLANPPILQRLRAELAPLVSGAKGEELSISELEQLPYFRAVILEGLRISYGLVGRLPRVAHTPLKYDGWEIPAGVPVSMTSIYLHDDPSIFPEPTKFDPDRWLEKDASRREKYLVNFGKGTRSCLGMNLARVEILLTCAAIFGGSFDLELYETDRSDVDIVHDFLNPYPKLESEGVRVTIS